MHTLAYGMNLQSLFRQQIVNLASCAHCDIYYAFIPRRRRIAPGIARERYSLKFREKSGERRGIEGIRRSVMCTLKRKLKLRSSRY